MLSGCWNTFIVRPGCARVVSINIFPAGIKIRQLDIVRTVKDAHELLFSVTMALPFSQVFLSFVFFCLP